MGEVCFFERMQDTCPDKVSVLRNLILRDVEQREGQILFPSKYRIFTISLPRFLEFRELDDLYRIRYIDIDMQDDLERSEVLNWCRTAEPLYPVKTSGDGNCLLHAVSQALWGIEDTDMFLRRLLYLNIVTDPTESFRKRWLFHQRNNSDLLQADVRLNTVEVSQEWDMVIKATNDLTQSQTGDLPYTALESIHLYVSANMLKRPIIVLADSMARNVFGQTMQDNQIGGIYLPLEWKPEQCNKNPIIIGYNMNHFCPLVLKGKSGNGIQEELLQAVPIVTKQMDSLPARFLLPNEEAEYYSIICRYLNMTEVVHNMTPVPAAKLNVVPLPNDVNIVEANSRDCLSKWKRLTGEIVSNEVAHNQPQPPPGHFGVKRVASPKIERERIKHDVKSARHVARNRCVTIGCDLFADPEMQNLCSKCFKEFTVQFANQEAAARTLAGLPQTMVPKRPFAVNPPQGQGHHTATARQVSYHDLSMIGEDCQTGCGFKCSVETYPYCHECYPKYTQQGAVGQLPTSNQLTEMSLMPDKCQNPACGFKCSKATYPYCHRCFSAVNKANTTEPSAPPPSIPVQPFNVGTAVGQNISIGNALQPPPSPQPIISNIGTPIVVENQHLPHTEPMDFQPYAGALDKKCMAAGCVSPAIKGNNGYCNNCYEQAMFSSTPVMQHSSTRSTEAAQCFTPGCTEQLTSGTNHCTQCFLKGDTTSTQSTSLTGVAPPMNIQPSLKIMNLPQRQRNVLPSIPSEHEETYPIQTNQSPMAVNLQKEEQLALEKKFICSKPGCNGLRGMNDAGLCGSCLYDQQGTGEIQENQVSDLENSQLYASCNGAQLSNEEMMRLNPIVKSSRDKVNCASPSCKAMIYPPKKLCDECSTVLQKHQATKSMEINIKDAGENGAKCLTEGCQFYGMPQTNGYCSSCHKSHVSLTRHSVPIMKRSATSTNTAPIVHKHAVLKTHTALVGKLCITPGCTKYGDPRQADRCSQHYEQEIMVSPHMSPESIQEQRNLIALQQQGYTITSDKYNVAGSKYPDQTTQGLGQTGGRTSASGGSRLKVEKSSETFDDVYNKLLTSKRTNRHCRNQTVGCFNFENPARNGYCNTCYSRLGNAYK